MSRIFYVNGEFVEEGLAKISVLDRGFLFADAVYEVTSVLQGKLVDNKGHLARLKRSLAEIGIRTPLADADIESVQLELLKRNGLEEGLVYLQVTRGVADRDFGFPPESTEPGLVLFTQQKNILQDPVANRGLRVISAEDIRWKRRDIKTVGLLAPSMAKQAARSAGADDAWMVENGLVTEGSSNNAYIVKSNGDIQTRQLGNQILSGITRQAVLELCRRDGTTVVEEAFTIQDVKDATEAFITSASAFVMPVVEMDGVAIGSGKPGPLVARLRQLYIEIALSDLSG